MWKLRLEEMQDVDDSDHHHHHHHPEQQQPQRHRRRVAQVCDVRRHERLNWRRMSVSDLRSERSVSGRSGLLRSLPRLFSRLVTGFSRSLAFLATSDELTVVPSSSSSSELEPHHVSLDDEVD